jgi:glycosyltransferase involved in cell wall biosynthesis
MGAVAPSAIEGDVGMKAAVIIPARNEAASIGLVIDEIPREHVAEILVVDNGSTDGTAAVAQRHGARVVTENETGYGAACLKGLSSLRLSRPARDVEIVVVLDADHSDYPDDLGVILEPILAGRADLVIGSRVLGAAEKGSLPRHQRLGNAIACSLVRILYGVRFTDMGPFRAIRRVALEELGMRDRNFGWNAEMQVKAIARGLRIEEAPVRYRARIGRSKISGTVRGTILAGGKIVGTILRYYPTYLTSRRKRVIAS